MPRLFRRFCFLKMPNDAQRIIAFRRRDEAALCNAFTVLRVADTEIDVTVKP